MIAQCLKECGDFFKVYVRLGCFDVISDNFVLYSVAFWIQILSLFLAASVASAMSPLLLSFPSHVVS